MRANTLERFTRCFFRCRQPDLRNYDSRTRFPPVSDQNEAGHH
ncbi:hypothetical protein H206_06153 [Candidatus Electrothrix aarhusensis]|uniref:Uncharacterized protein n=1 Tax=Candidatus Electrothrix aarhusensis TaxID=1859131 RepID=A0A444J3C3_9BACT|nr:hypothetical protein H206_06153 [Candidatus Electrothrix aarhusensis]